MGPELKPLWNRLHHIQVVKSYELDYALIHLKLSMGAKRLKVKGHTFLLQSGEAFLLWKEPALIKRIIISGKG